MTNRTTVEIDQDLLERARQALGEDTTQRTVEEALRRVADSSEEERSRRAANQLRYLAQLGEHADLAVLESEQMWR